ncbi:Translin [Dipodascopsis uninucleata]
MISNLVDRDLFHKCQESIDRDADIREHLRGLVKDVEKYNRQITAVLQGAHSVAPEKFTNFDGESFDLLLQQREALDRLAETATKYPFYKYNGIWSRVMQNAVFVILLRDFIVNEGETITSRSTQKTIISSLATVAKKLGVESDDDEVTDPNAFRLTLDEYLHGTISLISELARLATNTVINANGEYSTVLRINLLIKELQSGFLMLNLKNDSLRTRADSIKYDIRKVEEVIYDLSLRKMILQ